MGRGTYSQPTLPGVSLPSDSHTPTPKGVWEWEGASHGPVGLPREFGSPVDAWINEVRQQREERWQHRILRGRELREELQRCRALGLRQRQANRLRRLKEER
mgnify:CR=1 FL=1